jgi:hypothetical protein
MAGKTLRMHHSPRKYSTITTVNKLAKKATALGYSIIGIAKLPCNFAMPLKWTVAGKEIDFLVAGTEGIIPIEAKASERVTSTDGRSVETFIGEHPQTAQMGLVIYPGDEMAEIRKNVWAIPDWYLFRSL